MAIDLKKSGEITKIVRVAMDRSENGLDAIGCCHGYGLLQGENGEEIYFIDSALKNVKLGDLRVGQHVLYVVECGPLLRADKIWIKAGPNQAETTELGSNRVMKTRRRRANQNN